MKYSIDKDERYTIFKLQEANLNSVVAPDIKSKFIVASNEGINNMIFDLSEVDYVDSSGLSAILTANRLWKNLGGSFVLTGVNSGSVKRLIEISRLDTILPIVPTVSEAIDYVMIEQLERELNSENDAESK